MSPVKERSDCVVEGSEEEKMEAADQSKKN
jgi:hypothetical protein